YLRLAKTAPVDEHVAPQRERAAIADIEQLGDIVADFALDPVFEALGDVALDADAELAQVGEFALVGGDLGIEGPEIVHELEAEIHAEPLAHADRGVLLELEAEISLGGLFFGVRDELLVEPRVFFSLRD